MQAGRAATAEAAGTTGKLTSDHLVTYSYIAGFGGYLVAFCVTVCFCAAKQQQPEQPGGFRSKLANNVMADSETWCELARRTTLLQ
eukprot:SAG22_NODE_1611_length_4001_cov_1.991287_5_plen_86_part_00